MQPTRLLTLECNNSSVVGQWVAMAIHSVFVYFEPLSQRALANNCDLLRAKKLDELLLEEYCCKDAIACERPDCKLLSVRSRIKLRESLESWLRRDGKSHLKRAQFTSVAGHVEPIHYRLRDIN